jgi:hypothetical protein
MDIRSVGAELFQADGRTDGRVGGQTDIIKIIFFSSQYILQSVRGHSAIVLTVTINGMQEIHPVIYLLFKFSHK